MRWNLNSQTKNSSRKNFMQNRSDQTTFRQVNYFSKSEKNYPEIVLEMFGIGFDFRKVLESPGKKFSADRKNL